MAHEDPSILEPVHDVDDALERALRTGELAAEVGFDWGTTEEAMEKVEEEVAELAEAIASGDSTEIEAELGDLLFAVVNVARKTGVDPHRALSQTHDKFLRRFAAIEAHVSVSGREWHEVALEEMEEVWQAAKKKERPGD